MISVEEALTQLLDLVCPLEAEEVRLRAAAGRVLAREVTASRTQPPFAASAMDGYALRRVEVEPDAMFKVIGEAAAGHSFTGKLGPGQAVRIFTGAPLPEGADFVVMQEDTTRRGDLRSLENAAERDALADRRRLHGVRGVLHLGLEVEHGLQVRGPRLRVLTGEGVDQVEVDA